MTPKQRLALYIALGANLALFAFFAWTALHVRTPRAIAFGMGSTALLSSVITLWWADRYQENALERALAKRTADRALNAAVRDVLNAKKRP